MPCKSDYLGALADRWEKHQKADAARKLIEDFNTKIIEMQKAGIAKLTDDEIRALGLSKLAYELGK